MTGATQTAAPVRARGAERFGRSAIDSTRTAVPAARHGDGIARPQRPARVAAGVSRSRGVGSTRHARCARRPRVVPDRRREPALVTSVLVDVVLTIVAVGGSAAAVWRVMGLGLDSTWIAAACLAVAAVASTPGTRSAAQPFAALIGRIGELGTAIAIVLGALVLAWLRHLSPAASLLLTAELCAIAAMIGLAGWLLVAADQRRQRAARLRHRHVLLLAGAADISAVVGAVHSAWWPGFARRFHGGRGRRPVRRATSRYLQHPLVALAVRRRRRAIRSLRRAGWRWSPPMSLLQDRRETARRTVEPAWTRGRAAH